MHHGFTLSLKREDTTKEIGSYFLHYNHENINYFVMIERIGFVGCNVKHNGRFLTSFQLVILFPVFNKGLCQKLINLKQESRSDAIRSNQYAV